MPHNLTALRIDEVSLVDAPACSEYDPVTGKKIRRSVVALYKRDADVPTITNKPNYTEKRDMDRELEAIVKSETAGRAAIASAVRKRAVTSAAETGTNVDAAEAAVWAAWPQLIEKYEAAPVVLEKAAQTTKVRRTPAELAIESKARARARKTGETFEVAYRAVLEANPELYAEHQRDVAANKYVDKPARKYCKAEDDDEPEGECPKCGADTQAGASYCSSCGTRL